MILDHIQWGRSIHGQAGGYWAPKYELVPKVTVDQKKRRQAKKSKYEFVYELEIRNRSQIRIRIYVLDVFAVKIRIGPLIFPPIRRIRGVQYPPPLPMYDSAIHKKIILKLDKKYKYPTTLTNFLSKCIKFLEDDYLN